MTGIAINNSATAFPFGRTSNHESSKVILNNLRGQEYVLYLQPKGATYGYPHQLPWTTTSGGDVHSAVNTAGIRAAVDGSTSEELESMRRDIAQAFARVVRYKYTEIAIPRDLMSACKKRWGIAIAESAHRLQV